MLKPLEEMTATDYAEIGLKSGLEVHQQLRTNKKLFCRCPAGFYSDIYHAEILRHMRPTLSELGEYDGTALMEFKTRKNIIYQLNKASVCTYEMDDAPPFELNEEALDIALEIALLLKLNLVSELHIARKQYLDGSIPTGFQRTTILGVDGEIPFQNRKIRIVQLGLEEDACREVSDIGHVRTYRTDRLGMPLIEVVTYPDMRTPIEVAAVAQLIRQLTRSTGKVNRGIGAARQDVNVSIEGGTRVEIKGVARIPLIPRLVHNEAGRQQALLEIRHLIRSRGVKPDNFKPQFFEVTDLLKTTGYLPIKNQLNQDSKIKCVKLPYFKGILRYPTQPDTNFAKEISDRVRVIACLDNIPNIIHSDTDDETISSANWERIKKISGCNDRDALVIVWGDEQDSETAAQEIAIRASEAIIGVPSETRRALADGTTGFERILPGPDRMYPDTDLPPIPIFDQKIQQIRSQLPTPPWQCHEKYQQLGLTPQMIDELFLSERARIFDRIVNETSYDPIFVARFLTQQLKAIYRKRATAERIPEDVLSEVFKALAEQRIVREAVPLIVEQWLDKPTRPIVPVITNYAVRNRETVEKLISDLAEKVQLPGDRRRDQRFNHLMGVVMKTIRGRIQGKITAQLVEKYIIEKYG
ncbi:MAG TPA: Glu-tRNA(Gln) amidotransferase subunit GatE [bacterium]|nr:Glu-tRNA(Gln) amidotransferase subunit GatE [bacterium]